MMINQFILESIVITFHRSIIIRISSFAHALRDPLHEREEAVFATLDYVDIQYLVDRIQAEVIWAMGLEDRVCHPKTQFAVYNHIQAPKKLYFYPEYGHEYLPKFNDKVHQILGGK